MPEEKPPVPTVLEVTKFMTSTAKRKRKLMFNSTPIVKGLYVSVNCYDSMTRFYLRPTT
jgi:hypothetical protein